MILKSALIFDKERYQKRREAQVLRYQKFEEEKDHYLNNCAVKYHNDDGKKEVSHIYEDYISITKNIVKTMHKVMLIKKNIFHPEKLKGTNKYRIAQTRAVQMLARAISDAHQLHFRSEATRFHPYVSLFIAKVNDQASDLVDLITNVRYAQPRKEAIEALCCELNDWMSWLKYDAQSAEVRTALNSWTRSSRKNKQRVNGYISEIYKKHARVLWVRIDVGYKVYHEETTLLNRNHVTFDDIKQHIQELLKKNASHGFFKHRFGYIYKIEYGQHKGYHSHILIALDGKEHCQGISIASTIGNDWKEITKGAGVYFSCNKEWEGKPYSGIGMVKREDKEKRNHLLRAASYLAKPDDFIRLATEKGARAFVTGRTK